ncbi:MAG: glycerophosphodiester phosphodiesterase [Acidimicrobiia bacterium]|nr:glycerophosphodiester phosphodiesterase [Acidimicrobiia bacterium]
MARLPSILQPPIAFAHRGASAHEPPNTLEAFRLGLRLGATGLESDVWLTADGIPVLDHDGRVRHGVRHRPIAWMNRGELPAHIPALADLYADCGADYELSLDLKDATAASATFAVARDAGALSRLWLCHPEREVLVGLQSQAGDAHLVHSTRLRRMPHGPERLAAQLANDGIEVVNLHRSDWTAGLTTLFHRFERLTFGWDAQHERMILDLLDMGIDGVYSNHVDRMMDAVRARAG